MTLSNTSSTRVDGWWMVIATVRLRLHISDRVSAIVSAVVESAFSETNKERSSIAREQIEAFISQ